MGNQINTDHIPSTTSKKQWASPELVIINQCNVNQPSDTGSSSTENSDQIKEATLQTRVKKAIRARHAKQK